MLSGVSKIQVLQNVKKKYVTLSYISLTLYVIKGTNNNSNCHGFYIPWLCNI